MARALLAHVFQIFQARGAQAVELKVEVDNPSGALLLYESVGMVRVAG
jgi:ribosomal protein S18 acetylase RimI-like enzyme